MIEPAVIRWQVEDFGICTCPECRRLDAEFPDEGVQLFLFRYVISLPPEPGAGLVFVQQG